MPEPHAAFTGSIPAAYDRYLGPLLFEFSATDLAERVARHVASGSVLEIACGTGISTHFLRDRLAAEVEIVATDLNPGMLEFAQEHRGALPRVRYELADALSLPYEDRHFDAVVCQFGIMFFPYLAKGLSEMRRVLRPGGRLARHVWDSLVAYPAAGIAHETIAGFFDSEPPTFLTVPFGSCPPDPTLDRFRAAGFEELQVHTVEATVERPSALDVARGFIEGNPGLLEIRERANAAPEVIVDALAERLETRFGPAPLELPLREYVFTGHAPRV